MKIQYKILIIEDEPIMCEAYNLALMQIEEDSNLKFNIQICTNYEKAKASIQESYNLENPYDLVVLDLRLPSIHSSTSVFGENLGIQIREFSAKTKIVIITSLADNYLFYTILKNINPEGFMIKSEIDFEKFKNDILLILKNHNCYTKTIINFMKQQFGSRLELDKIDRKILHLLSIGVTHMNLPKHLPLSLSGIEKRKRKLAHTLGLDSSDTKHLLKSAKKHGLV